MRLAMLAVPSFLALATGAGFLAYAINAKFSPSVVGPIAGGAGFVHPVTPVMVHETAGMSDVKAPVFAVQSVQGRQLSIGGPASHNPNGDRPQFVYFINDGCPCSFTAEPLFHALAKQFEGQVEFIGVTNVDTRKAKNWVKEMIVPYDVVADPQLKIIHAFHATSSAYSALVTRQGTIAKMWPGVSRDYLLDMNHELSKAAGTTEHEFDTLYAPLKPATGCRF